VLVRTQLTTNRDHDETLHGYQVLRLYADEKGAARFVDEEVAFVPVDPAVHELSVASPWPANGAVIVQAPPGGFHPEQPEGRRCVVIVMSGEVEVTRPVRPASPDPVTYWWWRTRPV
jgi:hypothetical protein